MMSFQRTVRYAFLITIIAMAVTLVYHFGQATARSHALQFLRVRENEETLTREQTASGGPLELVQPTKPRCPDVENKKPGTEKKYEVVVDKPVKKADVVAKVDAGEAKKDDKVTKTESKKPDEKTKKVDKPAEKTEKVDKPAEKTEKVDKPVEKTEKVDKPAEKTEKVVAKREDQPAKVKKVEVKTTKRPTTTVKPKKLTQKVPLIYVNAEDIIDLEKTYKGPPPFVHWPENVGIRMPKFDSKKPVPNILHLAWYGGPKRGNRMRFHHYVSFLSAFKRLNPKRILFWHDELPNGEWWDQITQRTRDVLQLVQRDAPAQIFDRPVVVPEHQSDVVRLEAVMYYGGVYIDLDVIVLNDFQPLYKYNTTMGYEVPYGLCNGIIVSKAAAPFLTLWYDKYHTFDDKKWSDHSVMLPATLAKENPKLIHTEADTMHKPYWGEMDKIYGKKKYNWRKNYSIHLWFRLYGKEHSIEDVKTMNSTFGAIFRYTLFDSPDLITKR